MARRIVWTSQAESGFERILRFYLVRNGNKSYSRKLSQEVKGVLDLIRKYPLLGSRTDTPNVRVVTISRLKLFYKVQVKIILVVFVLDNQEDPDKSKTL